ncbi:hypothetical protein D187_006105 [Cystobacter fuscus DSM 2262]|uniref:Uncharacterized protein n=1 Tax=Cystobacter fuscus (strain ATCC 25194 / DSM 2262 / NBRC 100088 / M29) TaxID=1242864 RepID=S9PL14_CYSF2|nr:hypothetical protein D187_006105 [Cystobacter fuscus DSM 2262]
MRLAGRRLVWPPGVPRSARFEEFGRNDNGLWGQFIHARGRASISWSSEGTIFSERYFDAQGRAHGLEVSRHDDGTVQWRVPWVRGQMHGLARQFDEAGRELVRTRFIRGSGIDLWVSGGFISELREHENSQLHGVERWGHPLFPYEENHYLRGRRAGISRRWKGSTLEPGYPHYFVDDEEVSRAEYLRARKTRPELPAYRRQDDRRERPMHDGLPHAWIRKDIRAHLMRMPTPEDGID